MAIGAVIVFEGQHGIGVQEVPGWREQQLGPRRLYLAAKQSLPARRSNWTSPELNYFRTATTLFQLYALDHRHPIVNGYSGWGTQLQELLGSRIGPLHEPGHMAEVVRGLRRAGVRYILLHQATFVEPEMARQIVDELQAASGPDR